jgi:hypothetical protein
VFLRDEANMKDFIFILVALICFVAGLEIGRFSEREEREKVKRTKKISRSIW